MSICWTDEAWEDYQFWIKNNKIVCEKINKLIKEIQRTPFKGSGKPEPLKYQLKNYWSRRITKTDRLIYKIEENTVYITQCRYHY